VRRGRLAALLLLPLTPLLLAGCGSPGTASSAVPTSSGSPWVVTATGSATASPAPSRSYTSPSPFPTGFLPISATSPAPRRSGSPSCDGTLRLDKINSATVVPSRTSATVTWYNPGGADLVQYRVTAISQDLAVGEQRPVGWTVITPGATCGYLSATVAGLDRSTDYVFSVDAVISRLGKDGTRAATVARSLVVRTT
jgi:hypothetical protein